MTSKKHYYLYLEKLNSINYQNILQCQNKHTKCHLLKHKSRLSKIGRNLKVEISTQKHSMKAIIQNNKKDSVRKILNNSIKYFNSKKNHSSNNSFQRNNQSKDNFNGITSQTSNLSRLASNKGNQRPSLLKYICQKNKRSLTLSSPLNKEKIKSKLFTSVIPVVLHTNSRWLQSKVTEVWKKKSNTIK